MNSNSILILEKLLQKNYMDSRNNVLFTLIGKRINMSLIGVSLVR